MNKPLSIFDQLNNEQKESCHHYEGPSLTLAIPGSGKTTLLMARTNWLINVKKINPKEILTVTFSKAAANDMSERYNKLFPNEDSPTFSTIHGLSYRILRTYEQKTGITYQLIEKDHKHQIIRSIYREVHHKYLADEGLEELLQALSLVENLMLPPEKYPDHIDELPLIVSKFREYKFNKQLIDFDDMLKFAYQLLRKYPKLLTFYQNKFKFIQMDEAQDTSLLQHRIIALLAKGHQNLFYVADDDQSIYGFRGAYPEMLLDFEERFPKSKIYYLSTNYRSTSSILSIAESFINQNENRYKKALHAYHDDGPNPKYHFFDTLEERNNHLVDHLRNNETERAILYRNHIAAIPIIHRLHLEGIPFSVQPGAEKVFDHIVFSDIKSFMQLAMCPHDLDAFKRIAFKTNGYFSKKQLEYLSTSNYGKNIFDALQQMPGLASYQKKTILETGKKFDILRHQSPERAMWYIDIELGYLEYAKQQYKEAGRKRLELIRHLAKSFDTLLDFTIYLDQLQQLCASEHYHQGTKLMTMHASKGLEFENVYLIDIDEASFSDESESVEEDRRLLYVAITRAKKHLEILSYRFQDGKIQPKVERLKEIESLF